MILFSEIIEILILILISTTKFVIAPAIILSKGYDYTNTILITFIGGTLGVFFYFYIGAILLNWISKIIPIKKKKKIFSRKNRFIIKIKNNIGIIGIALLIPIISIPLSVLIGRKYFGDREKIFLLINTIIVLIYSFILTFFSDTIISFFDFFVS